MLPNLGEAPYLCPLKSNHRRKVVFYLMMQFARRMLCETVVSYMLKHDLNLNLVCLVKNQKNLLFPTPVCCFYAIFQLQVFLIAVKMFMEGGSFCCSYLISFMPKSLMLFTFELKYCWLSLLLVVFINMYLEIYVCVYLYIF